MLVEPHLHAKGSQRIGDAAHSSGVLMSITEEHRTGWASERKAALKAGKAPAKNLPAGEQRGELKSLRVCPLIRRANGR